MNDENQRDDRIGQDIYNEYEPETAELPAVEIEETQSKSLDLSSVPDAVDGYGLPQQVDAINPDNPFDTTKTNTSGIAEFSQYDDTYFDDIGRGTEQEKIGAVNFPDEFEFGSDEDADDQHVRFIDERPQGAINGRILAVLASVGFVLIASLVVGYTLTRGNGDKKVLETASSSEQTEDETSTTPVSQDQASDKNELQLPVSADPDSSDEPAQNPASPVASLATPQTTTKNAGSTPLITTRPTVAPSVITKPTLPETTVDSPVTTVEEPTTTVEEPTTTVEVVLVAVPDVAALSSKEAKVAIEAADLVFKERLVTNRLDPDGELLPDDYVISSNPDANEEVEEGSIIVVTVNQTVEPEIPLVVAAAANP